ncbi:MAG: cadmium-translocating P-type ATPase [Clostridiales bacterium]|nr:cadmium-translocating P-type ATPase [Clostridiales bacterium]
MKQNHEEHKEQHHHNHEACGCGHDHEHEACGCGHDHGHEVCGCGHDHEHEYGSGDKESHSHVQSDAKQKVYILENLGCANCAAKMERKIKELPEVEDAVITFATKQLKVASNHQEDLFPVLQEICASIESEVVVKPKESKVHKEKQEENKKVIIGILAGAVLFAAGMIFEDSYPTVTSIGFVIAYLILGGKIVLQAAKNLKKGHVFDENFLMSIATLAAFAIGDFAEAVGVMLFYRCGELFEDIAVEKSRGQIMDAVDMRPEVVNLLHGDEVEVIPAAEAQIGDVLLVRVGDRIPLDGVILSGESRIDTAPVTGEPVPVKAGEGDRVISGCVNTSGMLKVRVEKTLGDSMVTRILQSVENAAASKPKIDRFITRFARVYTPFVVILALGTAIIPSLITGDWKFWIYTAITFLVISCPCALVLSVPLAFFSGIGAGSKKGILFKGGIALEALKEVKAVVMDKTGTITKGNFEVQKCISLGAWKEEELLAVAAGCESTSTHPIGNSIVEEAKKRFVELERPSKVEEISGKGIRAQMKLGEVLCGNRALLEMHHVNVQMMESNVYGTEVFVAINGELAGYLVIADTLKEDSVSAIRKMKKYGLRTAMLTGDAKTSADAIAKKAGVEEVYAQLLPEDKVEKLKEIRQKNGAVMFVGDGINDAPVLAGADVGAAMGSGADAAIEAADVVFMTSSMEAIPQSVAIAKATGAIAMQNVVFALIVKALVMILGLMGFANMWLAVFADTGVAMLCVLNSIRILYKK